MEPPTEEPDAGNPHVRFCEGPQRSTAAEVYLMLWAATFKRCAALIWVAALAAQVPVYAATYYVSQSGNDGNSCESAQSTTPSLQKGTLSAGVACLSAGDTLWIRGGTYTGSLNVIDSQTFRVPSATSWLNPVTIGGFPGDSVTLVPPYNVSGIRLTTGAPSYLIIQDLSIDMQNSSAGSDADAVYLHTAHHNRLLRLEVKNSWNSGIHFGNDTSFNEVLGCRIHDNGDAANGPPWGHGLYITASDNLFENNSVYDNEGYGFHIYNNHGPHLDPSRNVVRNNRVYGNGVHHSQGFGLVIAWGTENQVYNNLFYGNRAGISVYTDASNSTVYNNTVYGNVSEGIALQYYGSGLTIRNNISYGNGINLVDNGGSETPTIDHNVTSDPNFVNAAAHDFALRAGSSARDTGLAIPTLINDFIYTRRPQGSGYDVGAFEASVGASAPRAPQRLRILQ
ncbi:MAG: right-handed parallel beta-helix repeat-containing protein [Myxococcaceae bacterium]